MPWLPLHVRPWTTMLVLLGLNETQSSPLLMTEFWITMPSERYVSQPSVFLGVVLEVLCTEMVMSLIKTSDVFEIRLNH